jgi:hypothetical protein
MLKQKGYLLGMVLSFGFYKLLDSISIVDKQVQVYYLHVSLFVLQIVILYLVFKAFLKR